MSKIERRDYDEKFKASAIKRTKEEFNYDYKRAAEGIGMPSSTLRAWVKTDIDNGLLSVKKEKVKAGGDVIMDDDAIYYCISCQQSCATSRRLFIFHVKQYHEDELSLLNDDIDRFYLKKGQTNPQTKEQLELDITNAIEEKKKREIENVNKQSAEIVKRMEEKKKRIEEERKKKEEEEQKKKEKMKEMENEEEETQKEKKRRFSFIPEDGDEVISYTFQAMKDNCEQWKKLYDQQAKIMDKIEKENSTLKNSIEQLEKENSTLKNSNEQLEKENSTMKNSNEQLEKEKKELQIQLKTRGDTIQQLVKDRDIANKEMVDIKRKLEKSDRDKNGMNRRIKELERANKELKNQLEQTQPMGPQQQTPVPQGTVIHRKLIMDSSSNQQSAFGSPVVSPNTTNTPNTNTPSATTSAFTFKTPAVPVISLSPFNYRN